MPSIGRHRARPAHATIAGVRPSSAAGLENILGAVPALGGRAVLLGLAFVIAAGGYAAWAHFAWITTDWERAMVHAAIAARIPVGPRQVSAPNRFGDGTVTGTRAQIERYTSAVWESVSRRAQSCAITFVVVAALAGWLLWRVSSMAGERRLDDEHCRGGRLGTPKQILQILRDTHRLGDFSLAGVPLIRGRELQHILVVGTTGAGKSMAIKDLLDQIRTRGQRALVFDPECELVPHFYRDGRDVILNPFDARMPSWNLWDEIEFDYQRTGIAQALFPPNRSDPFFDEAAQTVLEDLVLRLREQGRATNQTLYEIATTSNLEALKTLLEGLPAARHVDPAGERKADSVLSSFINKIRIWKHLPESRAGEGFSIRRFVNDESHDGWLFLAAQESQMPLVRGLFSLWTSVWVEALLSLPKSAIRRIWTVLDELPALHRVRINDLLSRGRKRGACCVLGFQNLAQLTEVYGRDRAQTLRSTCNTWLIGRQGDPATAEEMSAALSSAEVSEASESTGRSTRDPHASFQLTRRRAMRRLVLDSELMHLEDLRGYLRQLTLPVVPVSIAVPELRTIAESYVPRRLGGDGLGWAGGSGGAGRSPIPGTLITESTTVQSTTVQSTTVQSTTVPGGGPKPLRNAMLPC